MGRVRLVRGHNVQLVRWRPVDQGWVADVRRGRRLAEDANGWTVLVAGRTQQFSRSEWTEFIGKLVPPGAPKRTPLVEHEHDRGHGGAVDPDAEPAHADELVAGSLYARSASLVDIPSTRAVIEPPPSRRDGRDAPGDASAS